MKRGIIIVPKEEMNLAICEKEFQDKDERHAIYMKESLKQIGIEPQIDGLSPWLWGTASINEGFLVLSIDEFSILFLPEMIDKKQCDWYYENAKMISNLKRLNLLYCYKDQTGNLHFLTNEETDSVLILKEIENQIEEKYESYQKDKKEGVKLCTKVLK